MTPIWLAPDNVETMENCYFRAVRVLNEEKPTTIDIVADSYYLLYINGKLVGRGPARGTWSQNYYDTYTVTDYLTKDRDVIALLVYCMNIDTFIALPSQPAFAIRLDGKTEMPEKWRVAVADDWRKKVSLYTLQVGFCECRDFRKEPMGWLTGKGSESWKMAIQVPASQEIYSKKLLPRDIPQLRTTTFYPVDIPVRAQVPVVKDWETYESSILMVEEKHEPLPEERIVGLGRWLTGDKSSFKLNPGTQGESLALIFDFEEEIIGRLEVEVEGADGVVVDICHEEELWNNRLRTNHPANDKYNFADRYILRDGLQIIGNTINERGFRLTQLVFRNFDKPITIHSVKAIKAVYPYMKCGSFTCDDVMLNKLWEVCGNTMSTCTTDIYNDCPWRERAFWVNDLIVENVISLELFGASAIHRHAFRMIFSEAREDGLIKALCPYPKDKNRIIFPATNLFMALMLKGYLMYSGDQELVKEFLPAIQKIFDAFGAWIDDRGVIAPPAEFWNFIDWGFGLTGIDLGGKQTAILNYLYVLASDTMLELADLVGVPLDVETYKAKTRKVGEAAELFFKPETKRLGDWLEADGTPSAHSSQLAHAIALLSDFSPKWSSHFEEALVDEDILIPELYLHYFVFKAMRRSGREVAGLQRIRTYWSSIIESGSPTIWEANVHKRGKDAFGEAGSLCHGFATSPVYFMQTVILGVEPLKPGFASFKLAPTPCGLKFAKGRVPTPHGNIYVHWQTDDGSLKVKLDVPQGTEAVCEDGRLYGPGKHRTTLRFSADACV